MSASTVPPGAESSAAVLASVSVGGALGSLARVGVAEAVPWGGAGFPWATFLANVSGAFLLGALVALTLHVAAARRLRPFLAVGVLGGYTTFSALAVESRMLLADGAVWLAVGYLAVSVVTGLLAVVGGMALTRVGVRRWGRDAEGEER